MTAAPYRAKSLQDDHTSYKAREVDRTYNLQSDTREDCSSMDLHGNHDPCEPCSRRTSEKYILVDRQATLQMPR